MKIKAFVLVALTTLICGVAIGQTVDVVPEISGYTRGTVYMGITYAQPLGSFRQAYPQADAFGGTFGLLLNPLKRPSSVEFGLQVSYLSQGVQKMWPAGTLSDEKWKTTHSIVPLHLVARIKPTDQLRIKPYMDCLAGISVFNTRTKIKQNIFEFFNDDLQAVILNRYNSTVLSYGVGAGILFDLGVSGNSALDIRFVYLQSPLANYVKRGDLSIDQDGYPVYGLTRSATNIMMLQLNSVGILTE
ncbi:hypothetical protein [Pontibacter harenae]|uniref:hypothetical protein n=1 Tax=Pontibacter harenae TaxID=2894083 RepID=UPI001E36E502|nr:hypothetical protein [Pontibacter harenae]MCC9165609.1 hypothetical protein [Pontibacter harenae]